MVLQWALVCHGLVTVLVAVSLLFGNWPVFRRTPIACIHQFIVYDAYDYFLRFVGLVFGARGMNVILSVEYYCCDRPNPALQILYIAIVGGVYYALAVSSFRHLPSYYLSEIHRYTSFSAAAFGVLLYVLASFSDPGTVTADNVSQYLSLYPYDNIIYKEKDCPTCKIPKPARSKHCSICNRCVARFDHHCGWMNTCIGEKNTRYFLAFLFWHFLLCIYGMIAFFLLLAGKVKELRVIYILKVYYGIEDSFRSLAPHVMQWLMDAYDTQVLLLVFFLLCSLLLGGFFCYHAHLCLQNTTTNETFKWQDYIRWQKKVLEAKASAAALKGSVGESSTKEKPPKSKWKSFFRRSCLQEAEGIVKNNIYDKGYLHNVMEVIYPPSSRSSPSWDKSKSG